MAFHHPGGVLILLLCLRLAPMANAAPAHPPVTEDSFLVLAPSTETVAQAAVHSLLRLGFRAPVTKIPGDKRTTASVEAFYPVEIAVYEDKNYHLRQKRQREGRIQNPGKLPHLEIEKRWTDPRYIHPQDLRPLSIQDNFPDWQRQGTRADAYQLQIDIEPEGPGRFRVSSDIDKPHLRPNPWLREERQGNLPDKWRTRFATLLRIEVQILVFAWHPPLKWPAATSTSGD